MALTNPLELHHTCFIARGVSCCLFLCLPCELVEQIKSIKAGRSLRQTTQSSMKGTLELGLWAASRPEDFIKKHLVRFGRCMSAQKRLPRYCWKHIILTKA